MGNPGDRGNLEKLKAGYEYLVAYKLTVPIYDLTVVFCRRWIDFKSRTKDQMEQAARSGMQNVAEGNKLASLEGYLKLVGVARASQEELLRDYHAYARQNNIDIWPKDRAQREIREIEEIWRILRATPTLPDSPHFPDLPREPVKAVNLMITLGNQANYFLDKLLASLEQKFIREGGWRENLFQNRLEYRSGGNG